MTDIVYAVPVPAQVSARPGVNSAEKLENSAEMAPLPIHNPVSFLPTNVTVLFIVSTDNIQ